MRGSFRVGEKRHWAVLPGTLVSLVVTALAPANGTTSADDTAAQLLDYYLERSFSFFPTRATAAGRHDRDRELEDLTPERRAWWASINHGTAKVAARLLAAPDLGEEERLDLELVRREAERERFAFEVLDRPGRDPQFWTGIMGDATVFLLVRDDRPLVERLEAAAERAALLPRLAAQAREALGATDPRTIAPELAQLAARQAAASAAFYRGGFASAAGDDAELASRLAATGATAAQALDELARFLEELAGRATGDPRLAEHYAENFRLVTGVEQPVAEMLAEAQAALSEKRSEAAAYGRSVWDQVLSGKTAPTDEIDLLRELFHRVAADRAATVEEFVADYRELVAGALSFVRERRIIDLPDPFPLFTDRSPAFFAGQSVGGVYPPGPWAPEAATLWYLPTPPDEASPEDRDAFFSDFNHHFNVMITPHEIVPGHATHLAWAARHPRKARALFGDGVTIEGWGTFCERLLLDLGWGGPLDRLAHLKKQMENIARTVVDIRVHTQGMTREEVLAFVQGEALQDEQFAGNMWRRAITTSPQITFYWLGYREVFGLYEEVRRAQGETFDLARFMNEMMEMGPVPVARIRERMLGSAATPARALIDSRPRR